MSNTTCTQAQVDAALGRKIVDYIVVITSQVIAMTLAFCCSSFWLGLLIYIVCGLLLAVLAAVAVLYLGFFVTDDKFEGLGRSVGGVVNTVTGWFASKQPSPSAQSAS